MPRPYMTMTHTATLPAASAGPAAASPRPFAEFILSGAEGVGVTIRETYDDLMRCDVWPLE